ncbi:hypothetical protein F8388_024659 [Cannabis sativa]|uniref:Uncharacterized protein n=1 Tax=Cannabis sativa TaxID=3483 RepID=A0A7J6GBM8_CANSA|nr:hypothetical protein F8388_024659 [Cannabis sativa]
MNPPSTPPPLLAPSPNQSTSSTSSSRSLTSSTSLTALLHVVINKSKLLQVFYMQQQKLDVSTSLEKLLNVYLEEVAMERHRLALAKGSIVRGLLLTGGGDKVMRLWSLGNYKCLEEYSTPDSTSVIDFNFDEYKIVGLLGTRICIWRRDGARSVFPPCEGTFSKGLCMQYLDPEAMVGCEDGTVRVFDMYSKKCSRIIRMHTGSVTCLCVSDDQLVLSGSSLGNVSISSLSSDQQVSKLRTRDSTDLRALCFNPHSHLVFARATSGNMTIRILWENRVSPNVLYSLQHLRNDSSTLVVGGIDGSISSSRDKNGIVARTRGARLAEDVHTLR